MLCTKDYEELRQGLSSVGRRIAVYCEQSYEGIVFSIMESEIFIKFNSDSQITNTGFALEIVPILQD